MREVRECIVRVINQQQPPPIEQCASYAKRFHPSPIEYLLASGRYRFSNLNERRFVPPLPIHGNSSPTSWICIEPVVVEWLWRSRKRTEQRPSSKGAAFASRRLIDAVSVPRMGGKKRMRRTFQQTTWFRFVVSGECDERTRWNWKSFISAFEEYSRQSIGSAVHYLENRFSSREALRAIRIVHRVLVKFFDNKNH